MGRELRLVESGSAPALQSAKYANPCNCSWNRGYFAEGEPYSFKGSNHSRAFLNCGVAQNE